MKKILGALLVSVMVFGFSHASQATSITATLPEFSSSQFAAGLGSYPYYTVGTFNFVIPTGEEVVSAKVFGQWGNSVAPTTAHNEIDLDGIKVANTHEALPDPYTAYFVNWSYDFNPGQFSIFGNGQADLGTQMLSESFVRMGATTLQLETAPTPTPEPSSMILGIMGISSMLGLRRKK